MNNVSSIIKGYKILTLTFREVATHRLEELVLSNDLEGELFERLELMKKNLGLDEIFYLHTCNRILFFCYTDNDIDLNFKLRLFRQINPALSEVQFEFLVEKVKCFAGSEAINHLFEIAGSIDSMVVGEREILRQLPTAYEECALQGTTGDYIRLAMQQAVRTAKKIYDQTKIGEKPVSIVSLAIKALLERHPKKEDRILLLGAGQTMNLVCKFLRQHEFSNVSIANRTLNKAQKLLGSFDGNALGLDDLGIYQKGFDILITCTGHTSSWINGELYTTMLRGETDRKVVIDLAVPTNFKKEVSQGFNIDYVQVDDLRKIANANMAFRTQEVTSAKKIIVHQFEEFKYTLEERKIEKVLKTLPAQIKAIKEKAISEVFKKDLDQLDPKSIEVIHKMMDYMEKKCVSVPMKTAKQSVIKS